MTRPSTRPLMLFGFFMLMLLPAIGIAEAINEEIILIRNVRLIDRTGDTEDRLVSILVKDANLDIVTADEIPVGDGLSGYDAENGIAFGVLNIGEPANFLILDQDPRENIEILLDTKPHIVFAMRNGQIVENSLTPVASIEPSESENQTRWLAYTPPPMAIPLSYLDSSKWNRWDSRYVSGIFVAAVAIDRMHWLSQDGASEGQVGDLGDFSGGEIRAFRLGAAGTINFKRPWIYQLIVVTHAFDQGYDAAESNDFTIFDYRLDIPLASWLNMSVGKQKEPISMDRLLLGTQMAFAERAAVLDSMFSTRNVGVTFSGTGYDQRLSWAAGAYNDWFDESQSFDKSSSQYVGRVTGLPWVSEDESNLFHIGLGMRYDDGKESFRYLARPEFNQSGEFVDTGEFDADNTLTYVLESTWRRGPYWLAAEIVRNEVSAPQLGDPVFGGYHLTGSWVLTGEMRPYNKRNGTMGPVPVSKSVYQGGRGAWEATARYSTLDLDDGAISGGEMDVWSLGLNWYLSPIFAVNLNYRHTVLDRFGVKGHSDGIMARVVLVLE